MYPGSDIRTIGMLLKYLAGCNPDQPLGLVETEINYDAWNRTGPHPILGGPNAPMRHGPVTTTLSFKVVGSLPDPSEVPPPVTKMVTGLFQKKEVVVNQAERELKIVRSAIDELEYGEPGGYQAQSKSSGYRLAFVTLRDLIAKKQVESFCYHDFTDPVCTYDPTTTQATLADEAVAKEIVCNIPIMGQPYMIDDAIQAALEKKADLCDPMFAGSYVGEEEAQSFFNTPHDLASKALTTEMIMDAKEKLMRSGPICVDCSHEIPGLPPQHSDPVCSMCTVKRNAESVANRGVLGYGRKPYSCEVCHSQVKEASGLCDHCSCKVDTYLRRNDGMGYFDALALVKQQQRAELGRAVSSIQKYGQKASSLYTTDHAYGTGNCKTPCMTCSTVITDPDRLTYTRDGYVCDECPVGTCTNCGEDGVALGVDWGQLCHECLDALRDTLADDDVDYPVGHVNMPCAMVMPVKDEFECVCPSLAAGHLPDCKWKAAQ